MQWLVAIAALGVLQLGAVTAVTSAAAPDAVERWFPTTVGTTWDYASRFNGEDAGVRATQVDGKALTSQGAAATIADRWDNLGGSGPASSLTYFGRSGGHVVALGQRGSAGSYTAYTPPQPVLERPGRLGQSFNWSGSYGAQQERLTTTLVGRETVGVADALLTDCLHYRTAIEVLKPTGDEVRNSENWFCPGVGLVRSVESSPAVGRTFEDDLVRFQSTARRLGRLPTQASVDTATTQHAATPGVDDGRTGAVPGGAVDLKNLAWSDARKALVTLAPVGGDDLVILAESDGAVSAMRPSTGEIPWRTLIAGPVVVSPVVAATAVLVAGADKVLSALDVTTGVPHWTVRLPDLPASAPLVVGDTVVVAGQDRQVRALRLSTGEQTWVATTADQPASAPVQAGDLAIVADRAGRVEALRLRDGAVQWSANLHGRWRAGPLPDGDRVVLVDGAGIVSAIDSASGRLRWTRYVELAPNIPPVVAGELILLVPNGDRVLALASADGAPRWATRLDAKTEVQPLAVGNSFLTVSTTARLQRRSLRNGSLEETVALSAPNPTSGIRAHLPLSWIGGQVVVTVDVDLPWPKTSLLAFPSEPAAPGGPRPGARLTGELRNLVAPSSGDSRLVGSDLIVPGLDHTVRVVPPVGSARALLTSEDPVNYAIPAGDTVLAQRGADLVATPLSGGAPRWTFANGPLVPGIQPAVAGNRILAPIAEVGLVALDLASGTPLWIHANQGYGGRGAPVVLPDGDVVYAVGGLVRLDGRTGLARWSMPEVSAFGPIAVGDGVVVLAASTDREKFLLAVDIDTGAERWRRPFLVAPFVGTAESSGVVVAVDLRGRATGRDVATGEELWSYSMRTVSAGTPVILGDRVVLSEVGRPEDLYSRDTRLTVHGLRTGRFVASLEPPAVASGGAGLGATAEAVVVSTGSNVMILRLQ